jgi:hypothetical protein
MKITSTRALKKNLEIIKMLGLGYAPKDILRLVGVKHPSMISYWRNRMGIKPFARGSPRGFRRPDVARRVRSLKKSGMSYRAIGRMIGISAQRAQQYILPQIKTQSKTKFSCDICGRCGMATHRHHPRYDSDEIQHLCLSCHAKENWKQRKNSSCAGYGLGL